MRAWRLPVSVFSLLVLGSFWQFQNVGFTKLASGTPPNEQGRAVRSTVGLIQLADTKETSHKTEMGARCVLLLGKV